MAKSKSEPSSSVEVEQSLRLKKFSPLYLFYGEEDLLIDQTIDLLLNEALDESTKNFNLDIVSGENADAKDIVSLVSAFPMMADHRVVIIRNFDRVGNKELLLPIIENPVVTTIAVFVSPKPDFRLKLFKTFQSTGVITEFKQLYENEIQGWIGKELQKAGKSATPDACMLLQSYVGRSLREIRNELEKLLVFVGQKQSIGLDDITAVVGMSKRYNIFELQKAIGRRDMALGQEILHHMLSAGEYPVGMIVQLTKYFQKIWIIWDYLDRKISKDDLVRALHLSSKQIYYLDDEIRIARTFPPSGLERCFTVLSETDEALKSSDADANLLMTMMVYQLIRSQSELAAPAK